MEEIKWSEYRICNGTIPNLVNGYFNQNKLLKIFLMPWIWLTTRNFTVYS